MNEKPVENDPVENDIAAPTISTRKWISPVWILPIIALMLGASLLVKGVLDRGIMITLVVPTSEGMEVGKTKVMYRGINVGVVKAVNGAEGLNSVILTIEMTKKTEPYLTDETLFWVVKPQISLAGVSGLETILSGHYIAARPSDEGKEAREFVALSGQPPPIQTTPGLHIKLRMNKLASINKGTLITYKQIPVGKVTNYTLEKNDTVIHAWVLIEPEYAHLVKKESRFYNISGVKIDAGLSGIHVKTESLIAVALGGIAFYTPNLDKTTTLAKNDNLFELYDNFDAARVGIPLILRTSDASKLRPGFSKIKFQGLNVGLVTHFTFDPTMGDTLVYCSIDPDAAEILREDSQFWIVSPQVSLLKISGLDALLEGTYIAVRPGTGAYGNNFKLDDLKPSLPLSVPGLHIKLQADTRGSVKKDDPIYFKQILVGYIQAYKLSDDTKKIIFNVFIKPEFAHLIRNNTRFYNVSGINIKAGLSGIKVKTESLATILSGGVAFYTPDFEDAQPVSENNQVFQLYDDFEDAKAGLELNIDFQSAEGLVEGTTKLVFKGLTLGVVKTIKINKEKKNITAQLLIDPIAESILREGTQFWMVKPKISLSGLEHLDTLISGSYITFRPGKGAHKNHFKILRAAPALDISVEGLHIKLESVELGSVDVSSPVMYHRIKIGSVQDYELSRDKKNVLISVYIWPEYQDLINSNSRFYNASGIDIKADLSGVSVRTESIVSILKGGIALFNDHDLKSGGKVKNHTVFNLYDDDAAAKMNAFRVTIQFNSVKGLSEGSVVKYQGINVGQVKKIRLTKNTGKVLVTVQIDGALKKLLGPDSRFWVVSAKLGLARTENLDTLVAGNYIQLRPLKGKFTEHFIGLEEQPLVESTAGYNISLTASRLGSVKVGDPVYYRQIRVGRVVGYELAETADQILIHLGLRHRYRPLIRENTKFWHASGIAADINLFGKSKIRTESLESIISGGIAFATPDNDQMGKLLPENSYFILHDEPQAAWLNWNPIIQLAKETQQE